MGSSFYGLANANKGWNQQNIIDVFMIFVPFTEHIRFSQIEAWICLIWIVLILRVFFVCFVLFLPLFLLLWNCMALLLVYPIYSTAAKFCHFVIMNNVNLIIITTLLEECMVHFAKFRKINKKCTYVFFEKKIFSIECLIA